ncbi:PB1-F2 protein [Influenza A virus]|uniref:PB1-F2 protein n=1 Tax=Influenza A virus TaxID=11320 RepID=A0A3G1QTB1_9INFA|nr:PB1-F2 protein [Influenza A virus]
MELAQDIQWTPSIGLINIQKKENGQQIQKLEHPNLIQWMDHFQMTTNQVDILKQTVFWRQWLSLKKHIQEYLKMHA